MSLKETTSMVVCLRAVRAADGRVLAVKAELEDGNVVTYRPDEWIPVVGQVMRVSVGIDLDGPTSDDIAEAREVCRTLGAIHVYQGSAG